MSYDSVLAAMIKAQNALGDAASSAGISIGAAAMLDYIIALKEGKTPEQVISNMSGMQDGHRNSFKSLVQNHASALRETSRTRTRRPRLVSPSHNTAPSRISRSSTWKRDWAVSHFIYNVISSAAK